MAKRQIKFITVPISLWESADLTIAEKHLLIDIDSICDSAEGVAVGAQALASLSGMAQKDVKSALNELYIKGAIDISVDADGAKRIKPYLYKERYIKRGEKVVIGDKPTDVLTLPWEEIAEKWGESCPHLPPILRWTPQSKNKLRSALKNADMNLEQLYKSFKIIGATKFLNGTGEFNATFRWLISKSENLDKVYTGFYARSFEERRSYEAIIGGGDVNQKQDNTEDFYR